MEMRPDLNKELEERWKEKVELETTKDETQDPFVPAKLATHEPDEEIVVKVSLE
jgi:hypothetical protein